MQKFVKAVVLMLPDIAFKKLPLPMSGNLNATHFEVEQESKEGSIKHPLKITAAGNNTTQLTKLCGFNNMHEGGVHVVKNNMKNIGGKQYYTTVKNGEQKEGYPYQEWNKKLGENTVYGTLNNDFDLW